MVSTDSTTNKLIALSHLADVRHIDSLTASVRASADWFSLRHDLFIFFGFFSIAVSIVVASWINKK